jgi:hypothetical protein
VESCFIEITFRMAAPPVPSQSPNYLALSVALFSPYLCEAKWREIKRITQGKLDSRACAPQDSPDIVILAGHLELQYQSLRQEMAWKHFLGLYPENPRACSCRWLT